MKIKTAELETVCGPTSRLPVNVLPEVAFAGKSNVGKSSLINVLMQRRSLARTSQQPGKTQTLNFYKVNGELYFVDLPGYGYAKASKEEVKKWGKMIEKYLGTSDMLRAVFLLVDIRHKPGENDKQMFDWIDYMGYQTIVIATKADKIKRGQVAGQVELIARELGADEDTIIIPFSSKTKQGLDDVYDLLEQVIENEGEEDEGDGEEDE